MLTLPAHISFAEYQAIDAINMSALVWMAVSPKHYEWHRAHPDPDSRAKRVGRGAHTALLEPMQFLLEYRLSEYPDFTTKAAREWRDEQQAAGRTVLTEKEFRLIEAMREAVMNHPVASSLLRRGRHECTIQWTCPRTGLALKGRLDYVSSALSDLKTTRHILPDLFGRDAVKLFYPARLAFYRDGLRIATGEDLPVKIIAIENVPPHDVVVYDVPEDVLEAGRKTYEGLLDAVQQCTLRDEWAGVCESEELPLHVPLWALEPTEDDLLGLDLTMENDNAADSIAEEAS